MKRSRLKKLRLWGWWFDYNLPEWLLKKIRRSNERDEARRKAGRS